MVLSPPDAAAKHLLLEEAGFGHIKGKILDVVAGEGCGLVGLGFCIKNFFANGTGTLEELPMPIFSFMR